jgi:hypothetical protein
MHFLIFYRLSEAGQKAAFRSGVQAERERQVRVEVPDEELRDRLLEFSTIGFDGVPRVFFGEPSGDGGIVLQKFQQHPVQPVYAFYAGGPLRSTLTRIPAIRDNEWFEWEFDALPTVEELVAFARAKRDEYLAAVARFKRRETRKRERWRVREPEVSVLVNDMIRSFLENPSSRAQWDHQGRPFLSAPNRDGIWTGWVARFNSDIRFIREANRRRLHDREQFRRERDKRWRNQEFTAEVVVRKLTEWEATGNDNNDPVLIAGTLRTSDPDAEATGPEIINEDWWEEHREDVKDLLGRFRKLLSRNRRTLPFSAPPGEPPPDDPKTE